MILGQSVNSSLVGKFYRQRLLPSNVGFVLDPQRLKDPLLSLGLMLGIVPITVLGVSAQIGQHQLDARTNVNRSQSPKSNVSLPSEQPPVRVLPSEQPPVRVPNDVAVAIEPPAIAIPKDPWTAWLQANPVVRNADLTKDGTPVGQTPKGILVGMRLQQVADLTAAGTPDGTAVTSRPADGQRLSSNPGGKPISDNDLTNAGTPVGQPPVATPSVGKRAERIVDLSQAGTPLGSIPVRPASPHSH